MEKGKSLEHHEMQIHEGQAQDRDYARNRCNEEMSHKEAVEDQMWVFWKRGERGKGICRECSGIQARGEMPGREKEGGDKHPRGKWEGTRMIGESFRHLRGGPSEPRFAGAAALIDAADQGACSRLRCGDSRCQLLSPRGCSSREREMGEPLFGSVGVDPKN